MASPIRLLVISIYLLGFAATVGAQDAEKETPEYEQAIKTGLQEYKLGHFQEARAAFEKAHAIYPNARTLRGMGFAAFEARDYVEAIRFLRQSLNHEEKPLTDAMRKSVDDILDRALSYVWRGEVDIDPEHASLYLEGQSLELEDHQLILNPGTYEITVRAEGYEPAKLKVTAEAGRSGTIEVSLPPAGTQETAAAGTRPAPRTDGERFPWEYVVTGSGGALLVGSAVTGLLASHAEDDLVESCNAGTCDEDTRSRGKALKTTTNVLLGVGSAAVVGGLVWWIVEHTGGESREPAGSTTAATLGCTPYGCRAQARFSF